jgi:triacylglycerol lipase
VLAGELGNSARTALFPLSRLWPLPPVGPDRGRAPVVLVHGFLGHRDMMRPLERRLRRDGWTQVARVGWDSLRHDLDAIVARIADAVAGVEGPVDLVGHSLGAVACRAFVRRGGSARVRHFVSLGGPHAGTALYRFVPGPLRGVLDPNGPFVASMRSDVEPVPTTVIRAEWDHQILPPVRASLPGAREVVLPGVGHNGLLWARKAHDAVVGALT